MHKLSFVDKLILLRKKIANLLNISINNLPHYEKNDHLPKPENILQLSEFFGVGMTYVSRYETDKAMPNALTLIKLSDFFEVSIDYLLKDIDAVSGFNDDELFQQFKLVDSLPELQRDPVKAMLDGILKRQANNGRN